MGFFALGARIVPLVVACIAAGRMVDYLPAGLGNPYARWTFLYAAAVAVTAITGVRLAPHLAWPQLRWLAAACWGMLVLITAHFSDGAGAHGQRRAGRAGPRRRRAWCLSLVASCLIPWLSAALEQARPESGWIRWTPGFSARLAALAAAKPGNLVQQQSSGEAVDDGVRSPSENKRGWLWALLVGDVLALGAMAWHPFRKLTRGTERPAA